MCHSSFLESLTYFLDINAISISSELQGRFTEIFELHSSWSKKINITSNNSVSDFIVENIIDPALAYFAFKKHSRVQGLSAHQSLADVGCGGGFVGFTWHLLSGELAQLAVIDSDRKKINFCRDVIRKLSLQNCLALNARVEDLQKPLADLVVTRATWKIEETRNLCSGLAQPGALFLHFCGPEQTSFSKHKRIEYTIKPKNSHRQLFLGRF